MWRQTIVEQMHSRLRIIPTWFQFGSCPFSINFKCWLSLDSISSWNHPGHIFYCEAASIEDNCIARGWHLKYKGTAKIWSFNNVKVKVLFFLLILKGIIPAAWMHGWPSVWLQGLSTPKEDKVCNGYQNKPNNTCSFKKEFLSSFNASWYFLRFTTHRMKIQRRCHAQNDRCLNKTTRMLGVNW